MDVNVSLGWNTVDNEIFKTSKVNFTIRMSPILIAIKTLLRKEHTKKKIIKLNKIKY